MGGLSVEHGEGGGANNNFNAAALSMGVLVLGILTKGWERDDCINNFDDTVLLGLQFCFNLNITGDQDFMTSPSSSVVESLLLALSLFQRTATQCYILK